MGHTSCIASRHRVAMVEHMHEMDFGTGSGGKALALADHPDPSMRPREVVGADISEEMLEVFAAKIAAREAREEGGEGDDDVTPVSGLQVDERASQLADQEAFDVIIPSLVLHHIDPACKDDVYAALFAALAPGGVVFAQEFDTPDGSNSASIVGSLQSAGFVDVAVIPTDFDMDIVKHSFHAIHNDPHNGGHSHGHPHSHSHSHSHSHGGDDSNPDSPPHVFPW